MNSIYLFTAPVAEVNRGLWAVKREGLHGTGHLVLDAENFKLNTYIKPHQHRNADPCVHTLYVIVHFSMHFALQTSSQSSEIKPWRVFKARNIQSSITLHTQHFDKTGLNTLSQKHSLFDLVCTPWLAGLIQAEQRDLKGSSSDTYVSVSPLFSASQHLLSLPLICLLICASDLSAWNRFSVCPLRKFGMKLA